MGYKGTGKKICSTCKTRGIVTPLTEDNSCPSVFKKGFGSCRECMNQTSREAYARSPEVFKERRRIYYEKNPSMLIQISQRYQRTIKERFKKFISRTKEENLPITDPLYSLNFYTEFIRDNECHYCLGPLNATGHALDAVDNDQAHFCYNVVPCCKDCNQMKRHNISYEEMMLLAPVLREICKRREAKKWQEPQSSAPLTL